MPAENFLDLDIQHHDRDPATASSTSNSTIGRYNDLQKLFAKGNGPRPTLSIAEGADTANPQRDIAKAIRRRCNRSSSCSHGR